MLSIVGGVWTMALLVYGGFDVRTLGLRLSSHDPYRPLLVATVALSAFLLAGGRFRAAVPQVRVPPRWVAAGLAASLLILGVGFAAMNAGGADQYGYVSQVDLWIDGDLTIDQPWMREAPWPNRRWTFSPLGYRPVDRVGTYALVPTYSPGLPLLMAAAKIVAGHCAVYWVVPITAALLVLATFGVGARLGAPWTGVLAAWLVATSPTVLFMTMLPMTDVPVAAAWTIALYFVLGTRTWHAAAAGAAVAVALLIRPNLAPGAAILGVWYLWRAWRSTGAERRAVVAAAAAFGLMTAIGVAAVALINRQLYGSPTSSGYGSLDGLFSPAHVLPNLARYVRWMIHAQTFLPFVGLAALAVPLRVFWPAVRDRSALVMCALFVLALWVQYLYYLVFEDWGYLRFLLASWPPLMLGLVAAVMAIAIRLPRLVGALLIAGLVALGFRNLAFSHDQGVFDFWRGEARYAGIGQMVRTLTEPNAVVITMQHSGAVRYYGGRITARYDFLDEGYLDRAIEWFASKGKRVYLLIEDWELADVKRRHGAAQAMVRLQTPRATYFGNNSRAWLFDLERAPDRVDEIVDTFDRPRCLPPAPRPVW